MLRSFVLSQAYGPRLIGTDPGVSAPQEYPNSIDLRIFELLLVRFIKQDHVSTAFWRPMPGASLTRAWACVEHAFSVQARSARAENAWLQIL